jgi:hypothetical protein
VSDLINSLLGNVAGPVNTGPGPQYILQIPGSSEPPERPSGNRRRGVAKDQLNWLADRFAAPGGTAAARKALSTSRTVLLDGAPGSGRTTAARVLLHTWDTPHGTYHELLVEGPAGEADSYPDPDVVGEGDRLLLDLSGVDQQQWARARRDFSAFRAVVLARRARIAVVLPRLAARESLGELEQYRVEITAPRPEDVFLRHLGAEELYPESADLGNEALTDFLRTERPVREVAELARLVLRARALASRGETFAAWCGHAAHAMSTGGADAAALFDKASCAPRRALLVSTAMLHGAHPDTVHRAAADLCRMTSIPADERPVLDQEDLAERLKAIDAGRARDGTVRFDLLSLDTAVREHVWDNYPDLRRTVQDWVGTVLCYDGDGAPEPVRDVLVERLAAQFVRTGKPEQLASLAEKWATASASPGHLRGAVLTLRAGLGTEPLGRHLRRTIYEWSKKGHLPAPFVRVLVAVCAEVIAVRHPDEALVRLHHLARWHPSTPAPATLLALVEGDRRLRRRLLARLDRDLPAPGQAPGSSRHSATDLELFLRASDAAALTDTGEGARALLDEGPVREYLITGWSSVLAHLPWRIWRSCAQLWFRTACVEGRHTHRLLDVLVTAARGCGDLLGALYSTARDGRASAPGGPARYDEVTDLLLAKIAAAQRLACAQRASAGPGGEA